MHRLPVEFSKQEQQSYEVLVGADSYRELLPLIYQGAYSSVFVLSDQSVWAAGGHLLRPFLPADFKLIQILAGEEQKSLTVWQTVLQELNRNGADRKSLLINFGGGVIGDLGGFAAATYMRGIDFVQLPTSLLSQVDASVGGKTGVNFNQVKNLLGSFQQPRAVLINPETLSSLAPRELASGMAENIKHGLIADADYFNYLESLTWPIVSSDQWSEVIYRSVQIKAKVVAADPLEKGLRKILNFGHTAGHAIESLSYSTKNPLTHGEAIALGMLIEGRLALKKGLISTDLMTRVADLINKFNLPLNYQAHFSFSEFQKKVLQDKKNTKQEIKWVLLKGLGETMIDCVLGTEEIKEAFETVVFPISKESVLSLGGQPQDATVNLKGSKSLTNRALILAAQAPGRTILYNPAVCDDSLAMLEALTKFGIKFEWQGDSLLIERPDRLSPYQGAIDVGPAGTTMRFLTSFVSAVPGAVVELRGSERMHQRPISDLVNALKSKGVKIDYLGKEGCPPLKIQGRVKQDSFLVDLDAGISSQFLSSILLSSSSLATSVEVRLQGDLVSRSYVDLTIGMMREFGVNVIEEEDNYFLVFDSTPKSGAYSIDGDATGAGYFWCLAAATGARITVNNLSPNSIQGDMALLQILSDLGCQIENSEKGISVKGANKLLPIIADLEQLPDSAQTLAVLGALASGETYLRGLGTLKNKETDRLNALATELAKLNIKTEVGADYIKVYGGTIAIPESGVLIETYDDHRMAMSFAILAAIYPQIKIADPKVVAKSFPDFWEQFSICGYQSS